MNYFPDRWVVVKITNKDHKPYYKVFGCWYGGYMGGDSWKMNSGITKVAIDNGGYAFSGESGSTYICNRNSYGTSGYGAGILNGMIDAAQKVGASIEIMPETFDFLNIT